MYGLLDSLRFYLCLFSLIFTIRVCLLFYANFAAATDRPVVVDIVFESPN